MSLKYLTICLFISSLLFSNLSWAGEGLLDRLLGSSNNIAAVDLMPDQHNDVLHHLNDKHHSGHDCHMTAHLIGLNSKSININLVHVSQQYISFNIPITTLKIAPPSKPPRA